MSLRCRFRLHAWTEWGLAVWAAVVTGNPPYWWRRCYRCGAEAVSYKWPA